MASESAATEASGSFHIREPPCGKNSERLATEATRRVSREGGAFNRSLFMDNDPIVGA